MSNRMLQYSIMALKTNTEGASVVDAEENGHTTEE
jgi:hypothetical protein